jgi:hypothetical protein
MSNNHALASSPVLDSPSKVVGLIFLNSPSRWSTCFLFLSVLIFSLAEGVPLDELSPFFVFGLEFLEVKGYKSPYFLTKLYNEGVVIVITDL